MEIQDPLEGKTRRYITKVIIHCSDSTWGNFVHIDEWHKERWAGITNFGKQIYCGYHYIVLNGLDDSGGDYNKDRDGLVEKGRPDVYVGAHCEGQNLHSLGICLIGKDRFTDFQFKGLSKLLDNITGTYPSISGVYPHNKFSTKTCPNFDVEGFLAKWTGGYFDI